MKLAFITKLFHTLHTNITYLGLADTLVHAAKGRRCIQSVWKQSGLWRSLDDPEHTFFMGWTYLHPKWFARRSLTQKVFRLMLLPGECGKTDAKVI